MVAPESVRMLRLSRASRVDDSGPSCNETFLALRAGSYDGPSSSRPLFPLTRPPHVEFEDVSSESDKSSGSRWDIMSGKWKWKIYSI